MERAFGESPFHEASEFPGPVPDRLGSKRGLSHLPIGRTQHAHCPAVPRSSVCAWLSLPEFPGMSRTPAVPAQTGFGPHVRRLLADAQGIAGSGSGSPSHEGRTVMAQLRLLICEDEGLTTLRLHATLTRMGHDVVGMARDGEEAVAAAAALHPDAILMDVEMPKLNGIQATREIMAANPTAILILSAYRDVETTTAALDAGASGYLAKPMADDQLEMALASAVDRYLGGRLAEVY